MLWQITAPIVVGGLILLVLSLLSIGLGQSNASRWADISLIWLIIPAMVGILIALAMLVGSIFAVVKIIQVIPSAAFRVHKGLIQVSAVVREVSDRFTEPVLRAHSLSAALKTLKRQVTRS